MSYFSALSMVATWIGAFIGLMVFLFFPAIIEEIMLSMPKYTKTQAEIARFFGHCFQVLIGVFVVLPYFIVWVTGGN